MSTQTVIGTAAPAERMRTVQQIGLVEIRCNGRRVVRDGAVTCNTLLCQASPGSTITIVCGKCHTLLIGHVPMIAPYVSVPV